MVLVPGLAMRWLVPVMGAAPASVSAPACVISSSRRQCTG
jgi:hypothetical protein